MGNKASSLLQTQKPTDRPKTITSAEAPPADATTHDAAGNHGQQDFPITPVAITSHNVPMITNVPQPSSSDAAASSPSTQSTNVLEVILSDSSSDECLLPPLLNQIKKLARLSVLFGEVHMDGESISVCQGILKQMQVLDSAPGQAGFPEKLGSWLGVLQHQSQHDYCTWLTSDIRYEKLKKHLIMAFYEADGAVSGMPSESERLFVLLASTFHFFEGNSHLADSRLRQYLEWYRDETRLDADQGLLIRTFLGWCKTEAPSWWQVSDAWKFEDATRDHQTQELTVSVSRLLPNSWVIALQIILHWCWEQCDRGHLRNLRQQAVFECTTGLDLTQFSYSDQIAMCRRVTLSVLSIAWLRLEGRVTPPASDLNALERNCIAQMQLLTTQMSLSEVHVLSIAAASMHCSGTSGSTEADQNETYGPLPEGPCNPILHNFNIGEALASKWLQHWTTLDPNPPPSMAITHQELHKRVSSCTRQLLIEHTPGLTRQRTTLSKIQRLSRHQFKELEEDVWDEIERRAAAFNFASTSTSTSGEARSQPVPLSLGSPDHYHEKRKQARQKLAGLMSHRFRDLMMDTLLENKRRRGQGTYLGVRTGAFVAVSDRVLAGADEVVASSKFATDAQEEGEPSLFEQLLQLV